MCLAIIKKTILETFRGSIFKKKTMAKKFLADIKKWFVNNEKAETCMLLKSLISIRYIKKGKRITKLQIQYLKKKY